MPWKKAQATTVDVFYYDYVPQRGDVILELGAECGTETVMLSRLVGPTGRVIAVEASPRTFGFLRRTVEANRLRNVELVNAAVTDRSGTVTITDTSSLSNHVVEDGGGVPVPSVTVDGLVASYEMTGIDLLKMNIEGSERLAVLGMRRSAQSIRHMVISCHDFRADLGEGEEFRTSDSVDRFLQEWGCRVLRRLDDDRPWIRDYRYASLIVEQSPPSLSEV